MEKFRGPNDYIGVKEDCGCAAIASGEVEICPTHQPQGTTEASLKEFFERRDTLLKQAKDAHTEEAKLRFFRLITEEPPKKNDPEDDL